jgi:integral membrane sensor domain MASE1
VGTGALLVAGAVNSGHLFENWLTWWRGDVLGVLVFMPVVLIAPIGKRQIDWRGSATTALPFVALLTLMVPLGLTFYAWKVASEIAYSQSRAQFSALAAASAGRRRGG